MPSARADPQRLPSSATLPYEIRSGKLERPVWESRTAAEMPARPAAHGRKPVPPLLNPKAPIHRGSRIFENPEPRDFEIAPPGCDCPALHPRDLRTEGTQHPGTPPGFVPNACRVRTDRPQRSLGIPPGRVSRSPTPAPVRGGGRAVWWKAVTTLRKGSLPALESVSRKIETTDVRDMPCSVHALHAVRLALMPQGKGGPL